MKWAIIGLGIQGIKRSEVLGQKLFSTIDPISKFAKFKSPYELSEKVEVVGICTPNSVKFELVDWAISNNMSVLIEKPFILTRKSQYDYLNYKAKKNKCCIYVAFNHRFDPGIKKLKSVLQKNSSEAVYQFNIFYGNGTSRQIQNSNWKNKKGNLITDLGSHTLDLHNYLLGWMPSNLRVAQLSRNEVIEGDFATLSGTKFQAQLSYINWKSQFRLEIITSERFYRLNGLVKWEDSQLDIFSRVYPSGVPKCKQYIFRGPDKSWALEHKYLETCIRSRNFGFISTTFPEMNIYNELIKQI